MDRRKYLKTLAVGTLSTGVLLESCSPVEKETLQSIPVEQIAGPDRQPHEMERFKQLSAEKFFDEHEMKTISILADIIIPKDDISGSASDAQVPDFIEFIGRRSEAPRSRLAASVEPDELPAALRTKLSARSA